ncbi:hypothetical protein PAXRUDRAFT_834178 [Paxillus rubicundulus Ve08.2h10]|uniref:Unplaced genomic scaffold scaffold_1494, whole genome shotgun sequence n=1 Tax=Paxillus rubicundulus Ve08.2h10 TaxID=930991 RepID=A0A0D0DEH3_9AGAM|nr:hypothetical protein PAXRUDRAFT_834178 [Paxillus rubicundulus Ve08.2h10]
MAASCCGHRALCRALLHALNAVIRFAAATVTACCVSKLLKYARKKRKLNLVDIVSS